MQVLVYAVVRAADGWRYLMLHRIPACGGFWQGVTGGAEWGEELLDAARRELWEETHLRALELRALGCSCTYPMQNRWKKWYRAGTEEIEEHAFLAMVEGVRVTISCEEHDDWRWTRYRFDPGDAVGYTMVALHALKGPTFTERTNLTAHDQTTGDWSTWTPPRNP